MFIEKLFCMKCCIRVFNVFLVLELILNVHGKYPNFFLQVSVYHQCICDLLDKILLQKALFLKWNVCVSLCYWSFLYTSYSLSELETDIKVFKESILEILDEEELLEELCLSKWSDPQVL